MDTIIHARKIWSVQKYEAHDFTGVAPITPSSFQGDGCFLKKVPFRGAPCSDAAGSQIDYGSIVEHYESQAIGGVKYSTEAESVYFNFKVL